MGWENQSWIYLPDSPRSSASLQFAPFSARTHKFCSAVIQPATRFELIVCSLVVFFATRRLCGFAFPQWLGGSRRRDSTQRRKDAKTQGPEARGSGGRRLSSENGSRT